jgi:hypothetical protein
MLPQPTVRPEGELGVRRIRRIPFAFFAFVAD